MASRIFICGASVRSAAQSAYRAGLRVIAADLFCDVDLHPYGSAIQVTHFPRELLAIARSLPPSDWMYTGGLENEPDLVDAISLRHRLLGNDAIQLRRVRDPWTLAQTLHTSQLLSPTPCRRGDLTPDRTWLKKPLRSCGGLGIARIRPESLAASWQPRTPPFGVDQTHVVSHAGSKSPAVYYQPFMSGDSYSATFVASGGCAQLLGVTRQLVGCRWAGAAEFQYSGSIGPITVNDRQLMTWQRIGSCLAQQFGLRGLFGVDSIVSGDDIWTIEVNPRFCASVEILEMSSAFSSIAVHRDACCAGKLPDQPSRTAPTRHGKTIVFADRPVEISERLVQGWLAENRTARTPVTADLPHAFTSIALGHPILTVFAQGKDTQEVLQRLKTQVARIRSQV